MLSADRRFRRAQPPVAVRVLTRRITRDARVRTIGFAALFALYAYVQPVAYRRTYRTAADRLGFARSFGGNLALRLFYGRPRDLLTVSGYTAWRVGGILAIAAAAFGLLAAVRATRTEEESGRLETILAGAVSRRTALRCAGTAVAVGIAWLWLAEFLGLLAGGLPAGGSAGLALATVSVAAPCVGVGALAGQFASTRGAALGMSSCVVGAWFLLRVVADTVTGAAWLQWTTPLGWAEATRPFAAFRPSVLALPVALTASLLALAQHLYARRDLGKGLLPARDTADPRRRLPGSPTAQSAREALPAVLGWGAGVTALSVVLGAVARNVTPAGVPANVQRQLRRLGAASALTPLGYLAAISGLFVVVVSLLAVSQVAAARRAEAEQQLETLLALPVSRSRWLAGRLVVAALAVVGVSLLSGFGSWLGATLAGASVSLPQLLEAGGSTAPAALLFLGAAALLYATVPRVATAASYTLVAVLFVWHLVGALLGVPRWVADLNPFQHVGLVPIRPFPVLPAGALVAVGAAIAVLGLAAFRRRDLTGA